MNVHRHAALILIPAFIVMALVGRTAAQENAAATDAARVAALKHKLESIVIDKVNLDKADVGIVVKFLTQKSRELDPGKQGVSFVLRLDPETDATKETSRAQIHREVSLTLDHISLLDMLEEISQQTGLEYSIEPYAVYLRPSASESNVMNVRTFLAPNGFFSTSTDTTAPSVQKTLESKGIKFPPGASATFIPQSNKLVVRNTPEQLDLIQKLFGS